MPCAPCVQSWTHNISMYTYPSPSSMTFLTPKYTPCEYTPSIHTHSGYRHTVTQGTLYRTMWTHVLQLYYNHIFYSAYVAKTMANADPNTDRLTDRQTYILLKALCVNVRTTTLCGIVSQLSCFIFPLCDGKGTRHWQQHDNLRCDILCVLC